MISQRLNEYFADEASDYLGQLDLMLRLPGDPDAERLQRLAAGVRGSTKMAGADSIARLASRLEEAARSFGAARLSWNEDLRVAAQRTVTEIQELVQSLSGWGSEEENRVQDSLDYWDSVVDANALDPRPIVPIDTLFHDDGGPHVLGIDSDAPPVVPIESLLLRGDDAIRQALALRPDFDSLAHGGESSDRTLPDLVAELFDLLALGLSRETSEV